MNYICVAPSKEQFNVNGKSLGMSGERALYYSKNLGKHRVYRSSLPLEPYYFNGTDINMIIAMLEEQYRIMYNGRILLNENNNDYKKVADIMNIHQYRFQKAIESSYDYSLDDIFKKLIELDNIEIKSRTGEDPSIYFEQFITNM